MTSDSDTEVLEVELDETVKVPQSLDYNDLDNIPKLDGIPIKGNIRERDPTVPEWAKQPRKPTYSAKEVGAVGVDEMQALSIEELQELWDEA